MKFSISIQIKEFPVIILKDELKQTTAEIYSFGALLNSYNISGRQNIIEGFKSCNDAIENITSGFKSCKLSPFVCRMKSGKYVFNHKQYKAGKFFINEEAIHGLLYNASFKIANSGADEKSAFATLEYLYSNSNEGFPFEYLCSVTYRLEENNNLSISTTIVNQSNTEMPLCDGWHPYFKFDQSVDNLYFKINSDKMLEFDDRLLPTGKILSFNNFQTSEKLNDTFYDNCFLLNDTKREACIIEDRQHNIRLSVFPSEAYSYLQVYMPPHRNNIAIENLSGAPDAFNNKMGLLFLKHSESKTFVTTFQAEYF